MARTESVVDEKIGTALPALLQLNLALKCLQLYPPNHTTPVEVNEKLLQLLKEYISRYGPLVMSITKHGLDIDGREFGQDSQALRSFGLRLYRLRVQQLGFAPGVDSKQLMGFLSIACMDPEEVYDLGGVRELLLQHDIKSIAVREAELQLAADELVSDDELASSRQVTYGYLKQLLSGQSALTPESRRQLLALLRGDTRTLVGFMMSGLSELGGGATAESVARMLPKLGDMAEAELLDDRALIFRNLAEAILLFDKGVKEDLVPRVFAPEAGSRLMRNLAAQLSDEELAELLSAALSGQKLTWSKLPDVLEGLSIPGTRLQEVARLVVRRLQPSAEDAAKLQNVTNRLAARPTTEDIESVSEEQIAAVATLLDSAEKKRLLEELGTIRPIDIMEELVSSLGGILYLETEHEKYGKVIHLTRQLIAESVTGHEWPVAASALRMLQDEHNRQARVSLDHANVVKTVLRDISSRRHVEKLVVALEQAPETAEPIMKYFEALAKRAVIHLLDMLAVETRRNRRRLICEVLAHIGKPDLANLGGKTTDHRWYLVRNVVGILGQIGDPSAVTYMEKGAGHNDVRVRLETVRALSRLGPKAAKLLVQLLDDRDSQVRAAAVQSLGRVGDAATVQTLVTMLGRPDPFYRRTQLRCEVMRALGVLQGRPAIPLLLMFSRRKGWLFRKKVNALSEAAQAALREIGMRRTSHVVHG